MLRKNPEEYHRLRQERDCSDSKPVGRLLRLDRAFSNSQTNQQESLVVQAACELGCKCVHPCADDTN